MIDLGEYYVLYNKTVSTNIDKLRSCISNLRDVAVDRALVDEAANAAHTIKGATWTIRDTPTLLNNDPPDLRYEDVAALAEHLETHLNAILAGTQPLDPVMLYQDMSRLEAAILKQ